MSTLPAIAELAQLWPMILVCGIFAAGWHISAQNVKYAEYLWRMKCESYLRHQAHMEASR